MSFNLSMNNAKTIKSNFETTFTNCVFFFESSAEENKAKALNSDLSDNVEEYLSIAFHRFIERGLKIRLNNKIINPFNPFPEKESVITEQVQFLGYFRRKIGFHNVYKKIK